MIPENELMQDAEIIYHYQNEESGRRYVRTFKISEIKAGEDGGHLLTIPGFVFVGMSYPKGGDE